MNEPMFERIPFENRPESEAAGKHAMFIVLHTRRVTERDNEADCEIFYYCGTPNVLQWFEKKKTKQKAFQ